MATKEAKCKKTYIDAEGKETQSAHVDAVALRFAFANGESHDVSPDMFPDATRTCAEWFGYSEKLGNAYAKSADADEAEEKFLAMLELLQSGSWLSERESAGPRMSMIFEAVCRAYAEAGQPLNEDQQAEVKEILKTKEGRDEAMKTPEIEAAYEDIGLERKIAKRDAARKRAAESGGFQGLGFGTAQTE